MDEQGHSMVEPSVTERPKRLRRSVAEKRRIVEETYAPGASVARVAQAHGINANQVFTWRRLYQRGMLGGNAPAATLIPVMLADAPAAPDATPASIPGTIQLQLPKGRLRIEGAADPASLRLVLECLLG